MSTAKRNVSLDVAKGIGIILVVMGHAMSPVMAGDRVMEAAYRVLYVFHMPLFFMLSGLVASKLIRGGYAFQTRTHKTACDPLDDSLFCMGRHLFPNEKTSERAGSFSAGVCVVDDSCWEQS